jgi:Skp family chaperone for outer membrane proteins|tara:strand:- start:340 stop:513 length:174 start_codon:yes stop_codon:yes gene_type:complete
MEDKDITFLEKIQLYKKLASYFQESLENKRNPEIINLMKDLKRWGKDLKKRANYYDL